MIFTDAEKMKTDEYDQKRATQALSSLSAHLDGGAEVHERSPQPTLPSWDSILEKLATAEAKLPSTR